MQVTRTQALRALEALTKVNEGGSKNHATVRRLAALRARLLAVVDEVQTEHGILLKAHARRDDKGEMIPTPDGKGVEVENATKYQLEVSDLEKTAVEIDDSMLLTYDDLETLREFPDGNMLSVLLPILAPGG